MDKTGYHGRYHKKCAGNVWDCVKTICDSNGKNRRFHNEHHVSPPSVPQGIICAMVTVARFIFPKKGFVIYRSNQYCTRNP